MDNFCTIEFDRNLTWFGQAADAALAQPGAGPAREPPEGFPRPDRTTTAMSAARVKAIRRRLANSTRAFERRFGVPARTLEGWEQGRRVDVAAAVLLTVIERDPESVERALAASRA